MSSDILVNVAKYFDVSSDYILGLTPVRENNIPLAKLCLSEEACIKLAKREVQGEVLSKLIEHRDFGSFIRGVGTYFNDTYVEGVAMRNDMLHFGASFLHDNAVGMPDTDAVKAKAKDILRARTSAHEIELTEIRNLTVKIVKEIKEKIDSEKEKLESLNSKTAWESLSEKLREIAEEAIKMEKSEDERPDYVTAKTLEAVCAQTGMNMNVIKLLKPIYKKLFRSTGSPGADMDGYL